MSGMPSCARTERSTNSTIEWTIDCGCTTTSIRSNGTPNSQCASRTSRPLFMSVAESIVIFAPIRHVGWRSACSTVTPSRAAAGPSAEGSARRRQHEPADLARCRPRQALEECAVLGVDRKQAHAVLAGGPRHQAPPPSRASPCWRARWCVQPGLRRGWAPAPQPPPAPRRRRPRRRPPRGSPGPRRPPSSSGRARCQLPRQAIHRGPVQQSDRRRPMGTDQLGDQGDVGAPRREPAHAELIRKGGDRARGSDDRSIRSLRAR